MRRVMLALPLAPAAAPSKAADGPFDAMAAELERQSEASEAAALAAIAAEAAGAAPETARRIEDRLTPRLASPSGRR